MKESKDDLRVIKTREAIHTAFKEMVCEMDYQDITISKLAQRARINRKTFYFHYSCLDDLLAELQTQVLSALVKKDLSYRNMDDIKKLITIFFDYTAQLPEFHERLLCQESFHFIGERINNTWHQQARKSECGIFSDDEHIESLVLAYFGTTSLVLYRQWVKDGKKISIEKVKEVAIQLITKGLSNFIPIKS